VDVNQPCHGAVNRWSALEILLHTRVRQHLHSPDTQNCTCPEHKTTHNRAHTTAHTVPTAQQFFDMDVVQLLSPQCMWLSQPACTCSTKPDRPVPPVPSHTLSVTTAGCTHYAAIIHRCPCASGCSLAIVVLAGLGLIALPSVGAGVVQDLRGPGSDAATAEQICAVCGWGVASSRVRVTVTAVAVVAVVKVGTAQRHTQSLTAWYWASSRPRLNIWVWPWVGWSMEVLTVPACAHAHWTMLGMVRGDTS
jgi:hypothetical protein